MREHAAMNLVTGEVLVASTGNHLKKCVTTTEHYNRKWNEDKGQWIFAHGTNVLHKLGERYKRAH